MSLELQGTLHQLLAPVTGQGKNGPWKKQEFILEVPGNFPKKICIAAWGDKIDVGQYKPGDSIKVYFDVESREFNGRWYTDVKAWKIEAASSGAGGATAGPMIDSGGGLPVTDDLPEDDLPF